MIERQLKVNTYAVECDGCGETHDTGETTFPDAVSAVRDEGWYITNRQGGWKHFCPECMEGGSTL